MKYYVVLDTNVLVSAILKFSSIPGEMIREALEGDVIPVLCDEIIDEYEEVLARPRFGFDSQLIKTVIEGILERGIFVDAVSVEEVLPDPKDVIFYEVAMGSREKNDASYLVTGNIKYFPVKPYVVTPKEMLEIIKKQDAYRP